MGKKLVNIQNCQLVRQSNSVTLHIVSIQFSYLSLGVWGAPVSQ